MPPSDNTAVLLEASRRRSAQARQRAEAAVKAAANSREPVTVAAIARAAEISRSWLYTQTDLVEAINKLKDRVPSPARTGRQPASTASLEGRLESALKRARQLRAENTDLARKLEAAHAEIRRLRNENTVR